MTEETGTAPKQEAAAPAPKQVAPVRRSSVSLLLLGINFILLLAAAGLCFLYWEQQKAIAVLFESYNTQGQQQTETTARFAALDAKLEAASLTLEQALATQIAAAREQLAGQAGELATAKREISNLRLRLSDASGGGSNSWMLIEAESLLRLARQRLLTARDVRSAISLYLACDDLLRQINDPAVVTVRETLSSELDALRAVDLPDLQGMYERLGTISAEVQALGLSADTGAGARQFTPAASAAAAERATESSEEPGWFEALGASLSQYFIVRRLDSPVVPQLSAEQAYLTRQIIALHLEEARVALLREETRLYQQALDAASSDVELYLQGEGKTRVLDALAQLRATPIVAALPPAGATLNALRQLAPQVPVNNEGLQ